MAFTTADLTAVEEALAKGVLRVRMGDRDVEYRSVDELIKARDAIQAEISTASGKRVRQYRVGTRRGTE